MTIKRLTVGELIKILQTYPSNYKVYLDSYYCEAFSHAEVQIAFKDKPPVCLQQYGHKFELDPPLAEEKVLVLKGVEETNYD